MANSRMRTKPRTIDPAKEVKAIIDNGLIYQGWDFLPARRAVGFGEVYVYECEPSIEEPYSLRIEYHGQTRFNLGYAEYTGKYGIWRIDIAPRNGQFTSQDAAIFDDEVCTRVWGKARCKCACEAWQEDAEQRTSRALHLGNDVPLRAEPTWTQVK